VGLLSVNYKHMVFGDLVVELDLLVRPVHLPQPLLSPTPSWYTA